MLRCPSWPHQHIFEVTTWIIQSNYQTITESQLLILPMTISIWHPKIDILTLLVRFSSTVTPVTTLWPVNNLLLLLQKSSFPLKDPDLPTVILENQPGWTKSESSIISSNTLRQHAHRLGFPTSVFPFLAVATSLAQVRQDLSEFVDDDVVVCQCRCRLQSHH